MNRLAQSLSELEQLEVESELRVARHRKAPAVKLLSAAAQVADQPPMMAGSALALAAGLLLRNERLAEAGLRVLAATLATTALKTGLEHLVSRTRPNAVLDGTPYQSGLSAAEDSDHKAFPSGHTADAIGAARALARVYPEHSGQIWSAAGMIALIQLPSGAHYPSDLLAGGLVGLLGEAAAHAGVTPALAAMGAESSADQEPQQAGRLSLS